MPDNPLHSGSDIYGSGDFGCDRHLLFTRGDLQRDDALIKDMGGYIKMSDNLMADYPAVASFINGASRIKLTRVVEDQILNGSGQEPTSPASQTPPAFKHSLSRLSPEHRRETGWTWHSRTNPDSLADMMAGPGAGRIQAGRLYGIPRTGKRWS